MIDEIFTQRTEKYGDYRTLAALSDRLQSVMQESSNWDKLEPYQRESLRWTAHKIARALNGDPSYIDSWRDGGGYMELAAREIEKDNV